MSLTLVTLDVDGTLLPGDTCMEAALRGAGRGGVAAAAMEAWRSGKASHEATWHTLWQAVSGLTCQELHRALRREAAWLPGIAEGVTTLRRAGLDVLVLSDLPSTITDYLARWGLDDALASPVEVREGYQVHVTPRLDRVAALRERLAREGIAPDAVCHVGNGPLDVPVWQAVGRGVAVDAAMADHVDAVVAAPASFAAVAAEVAALA